MSSEIHHATPDEVRSLVEELAEVKELLRESSRQLLRIERRARAAFPGAVGVRPNKNTARPRLNERAAQELLGSLKTRIVNGEQIERHLREYPVKPDLQTLAKLLGMTNTKLPPKDELVRRISTRLRQSVSVTSGITDGKPISGEASNNPLGRSTTLPERTF